MGTSARPLPGIDFILRDWAGDGRDRGEGNDIAGRGLGKHLRWLCERLGERFTAGVVLHLGQRASSFGDGIHALPVSALWGHRGA